MKTSLLVLCNVLGISLVAACYSAGGDDDSGGGRAGSVSSAGSGGTESSGGGSENERGQGKRPGGRQHRAEL